MVRYEDGALESENLSTARWKVCAHFLIFEMMVPGTAINLIFSACLLCLKFVPRKVASNATMPSSAAAPALSFESQQTSDLDEISKRKRRSSTLSTLLQVPSAPRSALDSVPPGGGDAARSTTHDALVQATAVAAMHERAAAAAPDWHRLTHIPSHRLIQASEGRSPFSTFRVQIVPARSRHYTGARSTLSSGHFTPGMWSDSVRHSSRFRGVTRNQSKKKKWEVRTVTAFEITFQPNTLRVCHLSAEMYD